MSSFDFDNINVEDNSLYCAYINNLCQPYPELICYNPETNVITCDGSDTQDIMQTCHIITSIPLLLQDQSIRFEFPKIDNYYSTIYTIFVNHTGVIRDLDFYNVLSRCFTNNTIPFKLECIISTKNDNGKDRQLNAYILWVYRILFYMKETIYRITGSTQMLDDIRFNNHETWYEILSLPWNKETYYSKVLLTILKFRDFIPVSVLLNELGEKLPQLITERFKQHLHNEYNSIKDTVNKDVSNIFCV